MLLVVAHSPVAKKSKSKTGDMPSPPPPQNGVSPCQIGHSIWESKAAQRAANLGGIRVCKIWFRGQQIQHRSEEPAAQASAVRRLDAHSCGILESHQIPLATEWLSPHHTTGPNGATVRACDLQSKEADCRNGNILLADTRLRIFI